MVEEPPSADLKRTPLHERHLSLKARMVPFAGYQMPLQYADGIVAEHLWTRSSAGLFDVSHMGQAVLTAASHEAAAAAFERLVPGDVLGLKPGRMRYTQLTNPDGGILDDLMVTRWHPDGELLVVVNAARKDADVSWITSHLPKDVRLSLRDDRSLLALQGPKAEEVLAKLWPGCRALAFMTAADATIDRVACIVSRSGYTGEDGFEISVPSTHAVAIADRLLADPLVRPIGLGARDSLRLEAGLCLYGHDIDETTSPVEAALTWSIGRRRREAGGFLGERRILKELAEGPRRLRVGLRPEGRAIPREGMPITAEGAEVGRITSGGFGPSIGAAVAMGYVETAKAVVGSLLDVQIRTTAAPARIVQMPFVPTSYKRCS
ncbi:MAG: glycine cleavage system aminomethyltransferase GcvT [Hyphomicrobiales bacterium]